MNLLATIEKLEELEKKATPGPWILYTDHPVVPSRSIWKLNDAESDTSLEIASFFEAGRSENKDNAILCLESRNSLPTLLTALKEAIDLVETMEKVFEKYPMYARLSAEKMEPIGNPCTEFLKKWTTE